MNSIMLTNPKVAAGIAMVDQVRRPNLRQLWVATKGIMELGWLALVAGCTMPAVNQPMEQPVRQSEVFTLQEGDVLRITFPNSPNLDVEQSIRRDGKISLGLVGEVAAAGITPSTLEERLRKLYESQLVSNEITVLVVSSSYEIYVSGAVLRPGKIMAHRPLSALEAIMEAGGFDRSKADMTAVRVIRQEDGQTQNFVLNLKLVLEGRSSQPFYLRKYDIIDVPEKFSWF